MDECQLITLKICSTTGTNFEINANSTDSLESLKKNVAKNANLSSNRFQLVFNDQILRSGSIGENELTDGSSLVLVPKIQSGLVTNKKEASNSVAQVSQALESLTEQQINDFLNGRLPINLQVKLAGHVMLIQLQLSASLSRRRSSKSPTVTLSTDGQAFCRKLKELSKTSQACQACRTTNSSAVLENVRCHGRGVFSGKFSGTISPFNRTNSSNKVDTVVRIVQDILFSSSSRRCFRRSHRHRHRNNTDPLTERSGSNSPAEIEQRAVENSQTRHKMQQLRNALQQRKERRRARREQQASPWKTANDGLEAVVV